MVADSRYGKERVKKERKKKRIMEGGGHSREIFAVEPTKREFITFLSRKW